MARRHLGSAARLAGGLVAGGALGLALPALAPAAGPEGPAARLSETGLYAAGGADRVREDVLPFAPQYPLWTDGATKRRWIRLPPGKAIDGSRPDAWEFPVGTRLWKEFAFEGRPVETRFIERLRDGTWRYATYLWNADGTDAVLAPARGVPGGVEVRPGQRHVVPGAIDCRACHEGRPTPVLGFGTLQLSPDRDPGAPHAETPPEGAVDLRALVDRGLLRGLPRSLVTTPPRIAAPTPTARAALGYLHANCGTCHNGDGPLASLGLALAQEVGRADAAEALLDTVTRPSQFRIPGQPGPTYRVVPGAPELSALPFRMRARDPFSQMPPLGTAVVDEVGVALIERWIRETKEQENER
jgi:hypothetical protein